MIGIVHNTNFLTPEDALASEKHFEGFVDYTSRENATDKEMYDFFSRDEYTGFIHYADNERKTKTGVFSKSSDSLSEFEKEKLKKIFKRAQEKGSLMWRDVLSFDNEWLVKQDILDKETGVVDEVKLKLATRNMMNVCSKLEGMALVEWVGALHYNTDNIHIHVASVEPSLVTKRGKRKQSTLDEMKSKVANTLMDRRPYQTKINDIIRKNIVHAIAEEKKYENDLELAKRLQELANILPTDRRKWNYASKEMNVIRHKIDDVSTIYFRKYKRREFRELEKRLNEEEATLKEAYGVGERHLYKDYKENQIKDLYKRTGNTVLKQLKEIKHQEALHNKTMRSVEKNKFVSRQFLRNTNEMNYHMQRLKKSLEKDFESKRNLREYEQLEAKIQEQQQYGDER